MANRNTTEYYSIWDIFGFVIVIIVLLGAAIYFSFKYAIKFLIFLSKSFIAFSQTHRPFPKRFSKNFNQEKKIKHCVDTFLNHYEQFQKLDGSFDAKVSEYGNKDIMQIDAQFINKKKKLEKEYNGNLNLLTRKYRKDLDKETKAFKSAQKEILRRKDQNDKAYKNALESQEAEATSSLLEMGAKNKAEWLSWENTYWKNYSPLKMLKRPPMTRIGELVIERNKYSNLTPALIRIIAHKNVLINAFGTLNDAAIETLRVIVFRLLLTIPPGKVIFSFVDPVGLGSNMSGFMHMPETLVGKKILTESNEIERELAGLLEHIENVIQKYLRNDFLSLENYNNYAGETAEPYRILVVVNFPANFTESTAKQLVSIATNGPKSGVFTVVMRDTKRKLPQNFKIDDIKNLCTVINQDKNHLVWDDDDFKNCNLILDKMPSVQMTNRLLFMVKEQSMSANIVEVPFSHAINELNSWWSLRSDEELRVPIGRARARDLHYFSIGKGTKQHGLLGGITGSGKSMLLHVLIMSLCIHYSPDELELYLIDFKKGIEFKIYAENTLTHAKVIAIQSEREFALSVLQALDDELQRRGDLFRNIGAKDLKDFRKKSPESFMPRIVLIVDEFQEFFSEDDSLANQARGFFERGARQNRALGMHIFLSSQTLAGVSSLSKATYEQLKVRIALQCSEDDSRLVLGENNPDAKLLSRPGEAYYNDENGLVEGNKLFQTFYLTHEEIIEHLTKFNNLEYKKGSLKEKRLIVFEGNAPADIHNNKELRGLITAQNISDSKHLGLIAWLGEPVSIKPPTSVFFQRQSTSNLIIIGRNEKAATAMMISAMISFTAGRPKDDLEFCILNFSRADTEYNDLISKMFSFIPHKRTLYNRQSMDTAIDVIYRKVKEREEAADESEGNDILFFFIGLHRAKKLRSDDGYSYPEQTQRLLYILNNGPELGVHVICWGDTIKNIERIIGRNLSDFGLRVALQMSVNESNEVIESSAAKDLGQYKAILYDDENCGDLEKFRPYALPSKKWFESVGERLKKRSIKQGALYLEKKRLRLLKTKIQNQQ